MKSTVLSKKRRLKENIASYLFITPWLLVFGVFVAYPFVYGFVISLFDFDLVKQTFIGLENYKNLFSDEMFINSILATLKMCAIIIPGTIIFSLWVANTIHNRRKSLQSFTKVVFYLSAIVSEVALVIVWQWIFNPGYGLSATITDALKMPRIDWLGDVNFALPLVSYLVLAFTVSQPIVLYGAAFNNIPDTYYEAARIDSASQWKQFTKITLPLIKPTTTFVLITTTIGSLQVFMVPYLLTAGGPADGTTSILLMIFRNAFEYGKYGYAAAMGVILFIIIAIFAFFQFKATKSDVQY
jgi:multiple sugar transport system permease protein